MISRFALLFLLILAVPQNPATTDGIPDVVAKGEAVQLVKEGYVFTEGPVGTADGGLYFSDLLTSDRIHRLDPKGEITVFREKANAAGGLAISQSGELFAVETTGKHIVTIANGQVTVLTEGTPERPLLAPNDLALDSKGNGHLQDRRNSRPLLKAIDTNGTVGTKGGRRIDFPLSQNCNFSKRASANRAERANRSARSSKRLAQMTRLAWRSN